MQHKLTLHYLSSSLYSAGGSYASNRIAMILCEPAEPQEAPAVRVV